MAKNHKDLRSSHDKIRRANYLTRATCSACGKVFRSPKKRLAHVESGHKSLVGWNQNRSAKTSSLNFG